MPVRMQAAESSIELTEDIQSGKIFKKNTKHIYVLYILTF